METAPPLNARQVVHVPMWMWVDAEQWGPVSVEAAVSGGSVSVTATPAGSAWSMGDGSKVRCEGPGEPFDPSAHTAGAERAALDKLGDALDEAAG